MVYKDKVDQPRASRGQIGQHTQEESEDKPGAIKGPLSENLKKYVKQRRRKHLDKSKEFKKRWKKAMEFDQNGGVERLLRRLITRVRDMVAEGERLEAVHHILGADGIKGHFTVVVEPAQK